MIKIYDNAVRKHEEMTVKYNYSRMMKYNIHPFIITDVWGQMTSDK